MSEDALNPSSKRIKQSVAIRRVRARILGLGSKHKILLSAETDICKIGMELEKIAYAVEWLENPESSHDF